MTFAVHISLGDNPGDVRSYFNYSCFTEMARQQPDDHFVFIFDKPFDPALISSNNITPVLLGPQVKNKLLQHYWYQYKLPKVLSKYRADVYINQDKSACIRTETAQCMVIEDLAFMQKNNSYARSDMRYLKRYFQHFIKKSATVIITNESLKEKLEEKYPGCTGKVVTVKPGPYQIQQQDNKKLNSLPDDGIGYFICLVTNSSAMHMQQVLKSFSIFKKWQQSGMKLVVLSALAEDEFTINNLSTYKYRSDVLLMYPRQEYELTALISKTYAAIYLPSDDICETLARQANACNVPFIVTDSPFFQSQFRDIALFTEHKEQSLSEKMMRLYKDEALWTELKKNSLNKLTECTWENAAKHCNDALLQDKGLTFAVH